MLEQFLAAAPHAVAIEDGDVLFDFGSARYSVSGEGKCVLHMWSEERNTVRRVLDAEVRDRSLRLQVLRFGQSQPNLLEICVDRDRRNGTAKRAARARYQSLLERLLRREYPGFRLDQFSTSPDLEHSLQPGLYARPVARRTKGICGTRRQFRGDPGIGGCGSHLRHSLDGLPAASISAGRAVVEGLKLLLAAGPVGDCAPDERPI